MVVIKKRSASAALMGIDSSDEEEGTPQQMTHDSDTGSSQIESERSPAGPLVSLENAKRPKGFDPGNINGEHGFFLSEKVQTLREEKIKKKLNAEQNVSNREPGDGEIGSDDNDGEILEGDNIEFLRANREGPKLVWESNSEDGEIDEEPADLSRKSGDFDSIAIALAVSKGGKDVAQHNARYFMMDNVVCSHCGIKGHLSYDCPEEAEERRCFLCGKPGHDSKSCPDEACYYCGETGHRRRDCPQIAIDRLRRGKGPRAQHLRFNGKQRKISPPRNVPLFCYVCGRDGHVDCSLVRPPKALLSCCNCGALGHAYKGCPEPSAEKWVSYVSEQQREMRSSSGRKDISNPGRRARASGSPNPEETLEDALRYRQELKAAVNALREVGFGSNRGRGRRDFRGYHKD